MKAKMQNNRLRLSSPIGEWVAFAATSLFLSLPGVVDGQQQKSVLKRWAIIASPDLQQTGLVDQVTVELAKMPGIEVVERGRLDVVAQELLLPRLLQAGGVKERVEVGHLLGADALLILDSRQIEGKRFVHMVVSDCHTGARLHMAIQDVGTGLRELAVRSICDVVSQICIRHSQGVQRIIGVSLFVSKTLVHDFDYLKSAYTRLLESALISLPATAVLEIDEATAVGREEGFRGDSDILRIVPFFVEGEFEVSNAINKKKTSLNILLRLTDGKKVLHKTERTGLTMAAAEEFLRKEAVRELFQQHGGKVIEGLSEETQFSALKDRAQEFRKLGYWEDAIGLYEAALFLKPGNASERSDLIDLYLLQLNSPNSQAVIRKMRELGIDDIQKVRPEQVSATIILDLAALRTSQRIEEWRRSLDHLEYLIRNRQLKQAEAVRLFQKLTVTLESFNWDVYGRVKKQLLVLGSDKLVFLRETYPLVLKLPDQLSAGEDVLQAYDEWQAELFRAIFFRYGGANDDKPPGYMRQNKEDLDFLQDLLLNALHDAPTCLDRFVRFMFDCSFQIGTEESVLTEEDYAKFLQSLNRSASKSNKIYARFGILSRTLAKEKAKQPIAAQELLKQVELLEKDYREFFPKRHRNELENLVGILKEKVVDLLARHETNGPQVALSSGTVKRVKTPSLTSSKVQLEEINFRLRDRTGKTYYLREWEHVPGWRRLTFLPGNLLKCTDQLDVTWASGAVWFHREKGTLDEVLREENAYDRRGNWFMDVAWDGENVWVGTGREGIWLLSTRGEIVAKIGRENGLPPYDQRLILTPISRGKMLAVGSFGEHHRAWCAIIERQGGEGKVNVFFEATRLTTREREPTTLAKDLTLAFDPIWAKTFASAPNATGRFFLIHRYVHNPQDPHNPVPVFPLKVDLQTKSVSVLEGIPLDSLSPFYSGLCLLDDGKVLTRKRLLETLLLSLQAKNQSTTVPNFLETKYLDFHEIINYQGAIYLPASVWVRFDLPTLACEELGPAFHKPQLNLSSGRFAQSAHFGLVMWGVTDLFYKVTILNNPQAENRNVSEKGGSGDVTQADFESAVLAIKRGDRHTLAILLNKPLRLATLADKSGHTLLHWAVFHRQKAL